MPRCRAPLAAAERPGGHRYAQTPTVKKLARLLISTVAAAGLGLTMLAPNGGAAPAGAEAPEPAPRTAPAPQPASATVLAADLAPGHAAAPSRSATCPVRTPRLSFVRNR